MCICIQNVGLYTPKCVIKRRIVNSSGFILKHFQFNRSFILIFLSRLCIFNVGKALKKQRKKTTKNSLNSDTFVMAIRFQPYKMLFAVIYVKAERKRHIHNGCNVKPFNFGWISLYALLMYMRVLCVYLWNEWVYRSMSFHCFSNEIEEKTFKFAFTRLPFIIIHPSQSRLTSSLCIIYTKMNSVTVVFVCALHICGMRMRAHELLHAVVFSRASKRATVLRRSRNSH